MSKKSGSDIVETREDTARMEMLCSVEGYQKCRFNVDMGEEFLIYKKIGSRERAFKVTNTRRLLESSSILFDCRTQSNSNRSTEFDLIFVRFCLIRYHGVHGKYT